MTNDQIHALLVLHYEPVDVVSALVAANEYHLAQRYLAAREVLASSGGAFRALNQASFAGAQYGPSGLPILETVAIVPGEAEALSARADAQIAYEAVCKEIVAVGERHVDDNYIHSLEGRVIA